MYESCCCAEQKVKPDGVFIKNDNQVDEYVQRVRHTTVMVSVFTGNSNSMCHLHMEYFSAVRLLGRFNL